MFRVRVTFFTSRRKVSIALSRCTIGIFCSGGKKRLAFILSRQNFASFFLLVCKDFHLVLPVAGLNSPPYQTFEPCDLLRLLML